MSPGDGLRHTSRPDAYGGDGMRQHAQAPPGRVCGARCGREAVVAAVACGGGGGRGGHCQACKVLLARRAGWARAAQQQSGRGRPPARRPRRARRPNIFVAPSRQAVSSPRPPQTKVVQLARRAGQSGPAARPCAAWRDEADVRRAVGCLLPRESSRFQRSSGHAPAPVDVAVVVGCRGGQLANITPPCKLTLMPSSGVRDFAAAGVAAPPPATS